MMIWKWTLTETISPPLDTPELQTGHLNNMTSPPPQTKINSTNLFFVPKYFITNSIPVIY